VFTPKYRKKLLYGKIKRHLGQVFHDLARRKECRIEEGHLMPDHAHIAAWSVDRLGLSLQDLVGFLTELRS
jgi:REP element-mobilizing transposase RayT